MINLYSIECLGDLTECSNNRSLIRSLLIVDRTRRLGTMKDGSADVKKHRWFREIKWDDVLERKLKVRL